MGVVITGVPDEVTDATGVSRYLVNVDGEDSASTMLHLLNDQLKTIGLARFHDGDVVIRRYNPETGEEIGSVEFLTRLSENAEDGVASEQLVYVDDALVATITIPDDGGAARFKAGDTESDVNINITGLADLVNQDELGALLEQAGVTDHPPLVMLRTVLTDRSGMGTDGADRRRR